MAAGLTPPVRGLMPCMGGWCPVRATCAHYYASGMEPPVERLCEGGYLAQAHPLVPEGMQCALTAGGCGM